MHDDDDLLVVKTIKTSDEAKRQLQLLHNYMNGKPREPRELVKRIYKFVDKFIAADGIPALSPCKATCSKCCELPVTISMAEAYVIGTEYSLLAANFDDEVNHSHTDYLNMVCPFLLDHKCQIYDVRPIVCRSFFVMEPNSDNCGPGKQSTQFGINSSETLQGVSDILTNENPSLKGSGDIRYFFGKGQIIIEDKK